MSTRTSTINNHQEEAPAMSGFDVNQLTISGNLTRDPELRELPSGTAICSLRIAHNERFKDASGEWADRPQYFDVTVWSGLGDWIGRNLAQGDKVIVAGRLRWREWDTDGGGKRQAVDITADSVIPVPRTGAADPPAAAEETPEAEQAPPKRTGKAKAKAGAAVAGDDDIPF
jgi:single-strand DNA-binding protein